MRYFITGASGFIGSATIADLLAAGHTVVGLARSDSAAAAVAGSGASVVRGDLGDLDVLRAAAADSDGVIHLAFRHDVAFSGGFAEAAASDRAAITTMGETLAGTDRPLLMASGTAGLPPGVVSTETVVPDASHALSVRFENEAVALGLAATGVRSASVRFAPTVHGEGDHGFVAMMIDIARRTGTSAYVGDGSARWPAVHRLDAARLLRLAAEGVPAGTVLHAVAEQAVPVRSIAEVIGRHLDLPVVSVTAEEAADRFGFLAHVLGADVPSSSLLTQELLGWQPTHRGLIEDLEAGHYFGADAA